MTKLPSAIDISASNAVCATTDAPPPAPVHEKVPYRPRGVLRKAWLKKCAGYWYLLRRSLLGLVFPPRCMVCQEDLQAELSIAGSAVEDWLCTGCVGKLCGEATKYCHACAMPVPASQREGVACVHCQKEKLLFREARVLGVYQETLREMVLQVKRPHQEPLATALGRLLAERTAKQPFPRSIDAIVPIPMHWRRRFSRGTNAAESIGHGMSAAMGIPCQTEWLHLTREVQKQGLLSPEERRKNMRGAMGAAPDLALRGQAILLVDDVLTTGATASDAARALLAAGAGAVYTCALARGTGADS